MCCFCNQHVSEGIHLSNGKMVHSPCLDSIQEKEKAVRSELRVVQTELDTLQREIEKREGLRFKIISIFSKPDVDAAAIEKSTQTFKNKAHQLSLTLNQVQERIEQIYDYFLSYPPDWDRRRGKVAKRDGKNCSNCNNPSRLHLHHKMPLSKGGSNKISNLQLLCEQCHSEEHGGRDLTGEFTNTQTAFSKRVVSIQNAIEKGKQIKFGYRKPSDEGHKQRTIRPTMLEKFKHQRTSGSTLCVRGYCELRKEERVFSLKRMRGLKVL